MTRGMVFALCTALAASVAPAAESQVVEPRTDMPGRYELVAAEAAAQTIQQAVERAVDGMDFISQPMARGRLRDASPVRRWIEVALEGERVRVTLDGSASIATSLGARTRLAVDADGDADVEQRFERGTLVQVVSRDQGARRLTLEPTARGLLAHFRIESDRLPRAVEYVLEYARTSARTPS